MPTKIAFHECVHQAVAGPTPDHILASIRAEYCLPRAEPPASRSSTVSAPDAPQLEDFAALARALGRAAFHQLIADLQRQDADMAKLPGFLSRHRYGRATPALVDLARLELALVLSDRAPAIRSIGACCLPPDLLRAHPDLALTLHPAWHWLDLSVPADDWRDELLDGIEVPPTPPSRMTRLRVQPHRGQPTGRRLNAVEFAFEQAMSQGTSLHRAAIAVGGDGRFDPIRHLQSLLMEGAIVGVQLHPDSSANSAPTSPHSSPTR